MPQRGHAISVHSLARLATLALPAAWMIAPAARSGAADSLAEIVGPAIERKHFAGAVVLVTDRDRPTAAQLERLATSYRCTDDATDLVATRIASLSHPLDSSDRQPVPGGGLFSTAEDRGRFCRMLLGRGMFGTSRLLSEAAVAEIVRRQTPPTLEKAYGLGFELNPDGTYGHGGAYATNMTIDPARSVAVVWLVQDAGSPARSKACKQLVRAWALTRFAHRDRRPGPDSPPRIEK